MKKYAIAIIVAVILGYIGMNLSRASGGLLEETIKYNNGVYDKCFDKGFSQSSTQMMDTGSYLTDSRRYRASTDCWQSQRRLTPDQMFLTLPRKVVDNGQCSISQSEDDHVAKGRGGMYGTDLACNFESQGVYAPDYLDTMVEYKIESVGVDTLMGDFVILSFPDKGDSKNSRWYFGHTILDEGMKVGQYITTGTRFAHANISGATTGWHTHIELRRMYDGIWQSVRYVTRSKERKLDEKRMSGVGGSAFNPYANVGLIQTTNASEESGDRGGTGKNVSINGPYYFTHYDLGDQKQNDSSPCIGADGKDSCALQKHGRGTMALTVDIRNKIGVKFGDKVALTGDVGCEGVYTITDEMNCRMRGEYAWKNGPCYYSDGVTPTPRISHVKRPGTNYYIKGDLPGRPGGACTITKI